jgi:hypothetical protein
VEDPKDEFRAGKAALALAARISVLDLFWEARRRGAGGLLMRFPQSRACIGQDAFRTEVGEIDVAQGEARQSAFCDY